MLHGCNKMARTSCSNPQMAMCAHSPCQLLQSPLFVACLLILIGKKSAENHLTFWYSSPLFYLPCSCWKIPCMSQSMYPFLRSASCTYIYTFEHYLPVDLPSIYPPNHPSTHPSNTYNYIDIWYVLWIPLIPHGSSWLSPTFHMIFLPICTLFPRLLDGWETASSFFYGSPLNGEYTGNMDTPSAPFIPPSVHHWIEKEWYPHLQPWTGTRPSQAMVFKVP